MRWRAKCGALSLVLVPKVIKIVILHVRSHNPMIILQPSISITLFESLWWDWGKIAKQHQKHSNRFQVSQHLSGRSNQIWEKNTQAHPNPKISFNVTSSFLFCDSTCGLGSSSTCGLFVLAKDWVTVCGWRLHGCFRLICAWRLGLNSSPSNLVLPNY